jgi:hypothetical protein
MSPASAPAVLRFTLDTSCVIHAVSQQAYGPDVEKLAVLCGEGAGELWLTTAFDDDQESAGEVRLAANLRWIGERPVMGRIAQPMRLDYSPLDGPSILIDDRTADACRAIEEILLPPSLRGAALDANDGQLMGRWRRRIKDVQHLAAHFYYGHDVFVTSDHKDMIGKRDKLLRRTGIVIENPTEAVQRARNALAAAQSRSVGIAAPPLSVNNGSAATSR